jgi:hypothetical protein
MGKMGVVYAIWSILVPLEIFYGHLVHFPRFWYFVPRKIWQPCSGFTGLLGINRSVISFVSSN